MTEGVIPSLHVYYKNTHLKQYHKTGRRGAALRTETTINNSYDFGVGRLLESAAIARDRLCGQPPHARGRESQPRLPGRRGGLRETAEARSRSRAARQRAALWRRARAGPLRRAPAALPPARRLPQPATAAITCADARVGRKQHQVRAAELSNCAVCVCTGSLSASKALIDTSLTARGPAHGGLLSTHLCQSHPPGPLRLSQHLLPDLPIVHALHKLQSAIECLSYLKAA